MLWESCQNTPDKVEKTFKWPPHGLANVTLRGFGSVFETKNPVCHAQSGPGVICLSSDKAFLEPKWIQNLKKN